MGYSMLAKQVLSQLSYTPAENADSDVTIPQCYSHLLPSASEASNPSVSPKGILAANFSAIWL